MRQDLLVFVPQEGGNSPSVSYSMYACGVKKEKPEISADGKSLCSDSGTKCKTKFRTSSSSYDKRGFGFLWQTK